MIDIQQTEMSDIYGKRVREWYGCVCESLTLEPASLLSGCANSLLVICITA